MKIVRSITFFSDGSSSFLSRPYLCTSLFFNIQLHDVDNHSFWSGHKVKDQTQVSAFVSTFFEVNRILEKKNSL
ncbi:unnamed protein product [Choristocarpus tenellus]|uniref:ribosomal protein L31 n=1 Tax=Choristocarpus tenellus TaxID=116065 RepID=UPI002E7608AE|nr:ribosomal protein L31 [Choristocarpus tenellus]WBP69824.1 ribosomal protein L31 [Choristocarpus tenellus]